MSKAKVRVLTSSDAEARQVGDGFDFRSFQDQRAAALLASGLPPWFWLRLKDEMDRLESFGLEITPAIVEAVAAEIKQRTGNDTIPPSKRNCGAELEAETQERDLATYVVYYMRVGNRVKIGYTRNLLARIEALCPEEVLATEPGGRRIEAQRHRQFAGLRTEREWFRYEEPLTSWVAGLRQEPA